LALCGIAPQTSQYDRATIVTQSDAYTPIAGVALFVNAGLNRQTSSESGLAALVAQSILRTPVAPSLTLQDAVAARGGSVAFSMSTGSVVFYVQGTAQSESDLLALFARALAAPDFSPATLSDARTRLVRLIAQDQGSPYEVGVQMLGESPYGTTVALAQYTSEQAQAFYARAYRRSGATVSGIGSADAVPTPALEALVTALPAGAGSVAPPSGVVAVKGSSHESIARRDISAPWLIARYAAPAPGSRDFAAMLVLTEFVNSALADVSQVPNLVSRPLSQSVVGTVYGFDEQPATVTLYIDGGFGDPSSAFAATLAVIHVVGSSKPHGSIETFKASASGRFVADSTSLEGRAWLAGVFARNGSANYLDATLAQISAVTPADLQRVARKYLNDPAIALVLPRER
jgi:zinc protease